MWFLPGKTFLKLIDSCCVCVFVFFSCAREKWEDGNEAQKKKNKFSFCVPKFLLFCRSSSLLLLCPVRVCVLV